MKKVMCCLFCVLLAFSLTACDRGASMNENGTERYINASTSGYIYNDSYYYYDLNDRQIKYQDLLNPQAPPLSIYPDVIAQETEGPFADMSAPFVFILADPSADHAVLILAYAYYVKEASSFSFYNRIASYDTSTNKLTVIHEKIPENIQSLGLYQDRIFYTTNEGEKGYCVYSVKKDGKDHRKMDNPDAALYRIHTVYNDKVFYSDAATSKLYSCNLDFSGQQYLFEASLNVPAFVENDYLYYSANPETVMIDGTPRLFSCDLMRKSIHDLSANGETVLENVYVGYETDGIVLYTSTLYDANNPPKDTNYIYQSAYLFDPSTGENRKLFEVEDEHIMKYFDIFSSRYAILVTSETDGDGSSSKSCLNLKTGEETVFPQ